jgi:hypothetical protein
MQLVLPDFRPLNGIKYSNQGKVKSSYSFLYRNMLQVATSFGSLPVGVLEGLVQTRAHENLRRASTQEFLKKVLGEINTTSL